MIIGYARTSTLAQVSGFESQLELLEKNGCDCIYKEQISATQPRVQLDLALSKLDKGDVLVVTKLDRLARSVPNLCHIISTVSIKGASLRIIDIGIDTGTATGKLVVTLLGAVAEFEVDLMKERQREGVQRAKAQGKYKGRQPTARAKTPEIVALLKEGKTRAEVAKILDIGVASVYRVIRAYENNGMPKLPRKPCQFKLALG